jgi:hypothetical protein
MIPIIGWKSGGHRRLIIREKSFLHSVDLAGRGAVGASPDWVDLTPVQSVFVTQVVDVPGERIGKTVESETCTIPKSRRMCIIEYR